MLEMTKEGQEQRVNARHEGNQVAMNMLRVGRQKTYVIIREAFKNVLADFVR